MPLTFTGRTTLTPSQLLEFERVFTSFTDPPREDIAFVRDLEYMLKCLGYGYRKVSEEELASLRQVIDPTDSGFMPYEAFVSVIGRFVAPPADEEYLNFESEESMGSEGRSRSSSAAPSGGRIRSGSMLQGSGEGDLIGVVGRKRGSSLISNPSAPGLVSSTASLPSSALPKKRTQSTGPSNNNLIAHRRNAAASEVTKSDQTMEMWSTFKLFDKDNKGHITAGDLSVASTTYCGSMLSERDCFFIVNTLKTGWVRDGLTIDDFTKAMLM